MPVKRRMFRLHHHGGNLGKIQVTDSEVKVLHSHADSSTSREEAHHININSPVGPKIEKGGVSSSSGRSKGNGAHLDGRN